MENFIFCAVFSGHQVPHKNAGKNNGTTKFIF